MKGEVGLSINLKAWSLCSGLVSFDTPYSKELNGILSERGEMALLFIRENNTLYQNLPENTELYNTVSSSNERVLADYNGNLFTKIFSNSLSNEAGNEDFEFEHLPLGEYKYKFKSILIDTKTTECVKEIVGSTKYSEGIEVIVFFYLYPKGRNLNDQNYSINCNYVKKRLFGKDPRFRNCIEWICFMFDYIEINRLQYQQLRVLNDDAVIIVKKIYLLLVNITIRN